MKRQMVLLRISRRQANSEDSDQAGRIPLRSAPFQVQDECSIQKLFGSTASARSLLPELLDRTEGGNAAACAHEGH